MALMKLSELLQEAVDAQKAKENAEMLKHDASHGNKVDVLPTTVKADKNNFIGDKPDVLPKINEEAKPDAKEDEKPGKEEDGKAIAESTQTADVSQFLFEQAKPTPAAEQAPTNLQEKSLMNDVLAMFAPAKK